MKIDKLQGKLPAQVLAEIPLIMEKFGITNPLRLSHFLAQCGHESGGFKHVKENMNYSAEGLLKIFGKYFRKADGKTPDPALAAQYARNLKKLVLVYTEIEWVMAMNHLEKDINFMVEVTYN